MNDLNFNLNVLAIIESHIKKDSSSTKNLHLGNYLIEHTPTERSAGGTLLYVSKGLSYHLRNDLELYHSREIVPTFVEIVCSKSTNVILGCIYKHPTLQRNDFMNNCISPLLLKLQEESSTIIFLLGNFNPLSANPTKWSNTLKQFVSKLPTNCLSVFDHFVKLVLKELILISLKYKFSDSITILFIQLLILSNFLLSHIRLPIRISQTSASIDYILSISFSLEEIVSGNVTSTFLDHLSQYIFLKDFCFKITSSKI